MYLQENKLTNATEPKLAPHHLCTGCLACKAVCNKTAVDFIEDKDGFVFPKIDYSKCIACGRCEKVCPVLNKDLSNNEKPKCVSIMAKDEIRALASSGGFITELSKYFVENNGVVYGASWDKDWKVSHIRVDSEEDLKQLYGSKYFMSYVSDEIYKNVKEDLRNDRKVLFTGTPCEIAGIRNYTKSMKTDSLYTAEVICHGAPSYKVFKKYLTDNFDGKKIVNISFRNKNVFGWVSNMHIEFDDGTQFNEHADVNAYLNAFNKCLIMRKSCSACPFAMLPRQGDFTAGDFWGVSKYDKKLTDGKGTSCVLINNKHGDLLFKKINDRFKLTSSVPLSAITLINKTVIQPFKAHSGRKHFFSSINLLNFNKLAANSLSHKYDVGIVGLWYGINYGSVLTYFALYNLLCDLGYDPVMLPRPNNLWRDVAERFDSKNSLAQKFIWKYCNVFIECKKQSDFENFNNHCDTFIVGSDVVWQYSVCGKDTDQFFFLDWVDDSHKKIAFASSFGNGFSGPEDYKLKSRYFLNKFDYISVRELSSVAIMNNDLERTDIVQCLDPVFVCNPDIYNKVSLMNKDIATSDVFAYILNRGLIQTKIKFIKNACMHLNCTNPIFCANPNAIRTIVDAYKEFKNYELSVEEWLFYIKNAKFFIGDSYHGLCFSLIFHVPFIIVYPKDKNTSEARFLNLLKLVGLENRFISTQLNDDQIVQIIKTPINWFDVDRRLDLFKARSYSWIKNAMSMSKKYKPNSYDILFKEIRKNLEELQNKINDVLK